MYCFVHLKQYNCSKMVFDDTYLSFDDSSFFKLVNCGAFYPEAIEPIPTNVLSTRGNLVTSSCFVDEDHTGQKVNRRSHIDVLLFMNRSPIVWYSKRQNTV